MQSIKLEIASDLQNVRLASVCVNRLCSTVFNEEDSNTIELCVAEALNNCVKHAYCNSSSAAITTELQIGADNLTINIIDTGNSMPDGMIENSGEELVFDPSDPDSLPEGGMGIIIMKQTMDSVLYNSQNGVNTLTLLKKIPS